MEREKKEKEREKERGEKKSKRKKKRAAEVSDNAYCITSSSYSTDALTGNINNPVGGAGGVGHRACALVCMDMAEKPVHTRGERVEQGKVRKIVR